MPDPALLLLASPRRGPAPDPSEKSFKKQVRNVRKLIRLGKLYRKQTPKEKRSFVRWLRFLKANGPEFIGKVK